MIHIYMINLVVACIPVHVSLNGPSSHMVRMTCSSAKELRSSVQQSTVSVYNTGQSCVSVPSSHNMHTYVSNRDWSVHVGSTSWLEFLLTF